MTLKMQLSPCALGFPPVWLAAWCTAEVFLSNTGLVFLDTTSSQFKRVLKLGLGDFVTFHNSNFPLFLLFSGARFSR